MEAHHTTGSRRKGRSKMSVSWEPLTVLSAQRNRATDCCRWYAAVLPHTALFHIFPPLLSSRIFLSAQKRKIWVSFTKRARGPTFIVMPQAFFNRKLSTVYKGLNLQTLCIFQGTWRSGQAPAEFEAGPAVQRQRRSHQRKARKITFPTYYSTGYKRSARWEEISHSALGKVQGKKKWIALWTAVENERRFRVASTRKTHAILEVKCDRRLYRHWRSD